MRSLGKTVCAAGILGLFVRRLRGDERIEPAGIILNGLTRHCDAGVDTDADRAGVATEPLVWTVVGAVQDGHRSCDGGNRADHGPGGSPDHRLGAVVAACRLQRSGSFGEQRRQLLGNIQWVGQGHRATEAYTSGSISQPATDLTCQAFRNSS